MELVQRWWNGKWGRLARRDVWLEQDTTWHVRARQGDADNPPKTKTWAVANRADADADADGPTPHDRRTSRRVAGHYDDHRPTHRSATSAAE